MMNSQIEQSKEALWTNHLTELKVWAYRNG